MHLSLRQIRIFEAVARHRSYTRAAEELHLTQPAVFTQAKQLEEGVGHLLLERIGKQVYLTDAGREVLATCRETIEGLDRLEMRLADMQGLKRGRLRLAMVTTAEYLLPRLLGEFCAHYPGIEAKLIVSNREQLLVRMANNEDDLTILGAPPEGMAGEKAIPMARIAEEAFIFREPGSGTRLATERHFAEHGLKLKVRLELGSNEAIKQAIAGGLGVSVLSGYTLALEGLSGLVQPLDVQGFPLMRKWYVAYPKGKHLSAVAEAFLSHLLGK